MDKRIHSSIGEVILSGVIMEVHLDSDRYKLLDSCWTVRLSLKGVVYDTGESLVIFELNSRTNTSLSSVLLQTCASNTQH